MKKIKKITLQYFPSHLNGDGIYKTVRVEHTTEYNPGDILSKAQVDLLNYDRNWHVVTVAAK